MTVIIANNLRRLRTANGLTQEELSSRASISVAGYRNFESGRTVPKVDVLLSIANQLGVGLNDLVTEPKSLQTVRFRAHKRLNTREQILVDTAGWLDDFNEVEQVLGNKKEWKLGKLQKCKKPEDLASKVREELSISSNQPIRDICGLLESNGIKVWSRPVSSEYFFGLSVGVDDGGPAIVVNTWDRIPVERWIFSAAHELGHILMHVDSFKVYEEVENTEEEVEANRFASAFLMPSELFNKEWNETYGLPFLDRVFKVKRMLRVSYKTVLYRLEQTGSYPNIWSKFYSQYKLRTGRSITGKQEPDPLGLDAWVEDRAAQEPKRLEDIDFTEDRLHHLVRTALENQKITRDRAAEILRLSPDDMMDLIEQWVA